jgi:hypothetical protein
MKKKLLIIITVSIFLSLSLNATAQTIRTPQKQKTDIMSRLKFGGYLGLQFGTITAIDVSPLVIYQANKWFYPGIGFSYLYYSDKRYVPEYTSSYYGPRVFASFFIWQDLFAQVEYEALNVEYYDTGGRGFIHNIMLGGGYRQWLGQRAFMMFSILYNFNESIYSPYRNPIIRIGFGAGF